MDKSIYYNLLAFITGMAGSVVKSLGGDSDNHTIIACILLLTAIFEGWRE